ncbi:hypothetical protein N7540_004597 [Penicillium herquei]|nr:hypothetical protein N7540_004597 [Penicillium herquei]
MVSPMKRSKQKRASLESAFEGLNISSTPSTHAAAPKGHIGKSLAKMMKSTLRLAHGTVSRSVRGIETKFTITQDEVYNYKIAYKDFDPDTVFPEMMELESELQSLLQSTLDPKQQADLENHILECLTKMVYGSNMIEKAGCGLDITWNLSVLRSHREIVQHAKAAAYIITQLCLHDQDLSEELIMETHRILTYKVDAETAPWTQYSGVYRSVDVSAGFNTFTAPTAIPLKMKEMIRQLESDMSEAIKSGSIDPISLAAKYTHIFVNIHPFLDGNGRMYRLILNSMLLKFGSFIVCLGELGPERSLYLEVASSASQLESTYDGREEEEKPVMYKELASLVLSYAKTSLGKLVNAIAK